MDTYEDWDKFRIYPTAGGIREQDPAWLASRDVLHWLVAFEMAKLLRADPKSKSGAKELG